jgi:hypothetical protein
LLFTGRLSRDKRGIGSIIGAVFLILILLSGYAFYTLNFNVTRGYTETLQDMQQLDLERNKENIEFVSVLFSLNELNITVRNMGSCQSHLIWLGIFNETITPNMQYYYKIDFYINPAETIPNVGNSSMDDFEGQKRVIQLVTELGNTFSYGYPPSEDESAQIYDFVDSNSSDVDLSPNKGTHSFFPAMKAGPDGICDVLNETIESSKDNTTLINQESFEGFWPPFLPSPWTETGRWNRENDRAYDGYYSADFDGLPGRSGDLMTCDLDCSDASAINVDFWYRDESCEPNEFQLYYYDGASWQLIADLGATTSEFQWLQYKEKITDSRYFVSNFRIGWFATTDQTNDHMYVDLVTVKKESNILANCVMDLEVQWTSVNFNEENEWLSIYCGTMGNETVLVDVWNGTAWINIIANLSSGWNSVDVSSYLTSPTFTIRFKGGTEIGDLILDSWEIDAAFLYVWTEGA